MTVSLVIIDDPAPHVRRVTLNRPEKRNALNHTLRGNLIDALQAADQDDDVRVSIVRGAGTSFSAGYDLGGGNEGLELPHFTAGGEGQWPRHVTETWMGIWDLAKPVIAQVHGYCLAGGTELATACDLVYVAEDAQIGYPPARVWGVPTTGMWVHRIGLERAKRLLYTGDCLSGREAVEWGLAIECAPRAELDARFEALLERIARVPVNQLVMHKLMCNQTVMAQGLYTTQAMSIYFDGIARHTREGYGFQQRAMQAGFKQAVRDRDEPFGDAGPSTFKG